MTSKYYCDLKQGRTKGDDLDIKTLKWISEEIIKLQTPNDDTHRYSPVHRILSDVMNREIGT